MGEQWPFVDVIIPAAGRSSRMGGTDKLLWKLSGLPVLLRSAMIFDKALQHRRIIIPVSAENRENIANLLASHAWLGEPPLLAEGGATRQESVFSATPLLSGEGGMVAVHDGARPFLHPADLFSVLKAAASGGAAFLCTKMRESVHLLQNHAAVSALNRENLVAAQTPQVFSANLFQKMAEVAPLGVYTDECAIAMDLGVAIAPVFAKHPNIKLTTREDLAMAEGFAPRNTSVGFGYDVHTLTPGRKLVLGGVEIPFALGLAGHSDADVLTHAIMDSLLGASASGDIGTLFPDTDETYHNADSMVLLRRVAALIRQKGFRIGNIDAVVVAQKPKLAPFRQAMTASLCQALALEETQLNLKATTEEGLGFTGAGEGIAAKAVALLYKDTAGGFLDAND